MGCFVPPHLERRGLQIGADTLQGIAISPREMRIFGARISISIKTYMIHNTSKPSRGKGLIVLSGGMDSVTLLYDYRAEIAMGLSMDYGSKHNASEIPYAQEHCQALGIPHLILPLDFMGKYFRSDLLLTGGAIPTEDYNEANMASTVVPFRNGIMLSIAAGIAESYDLESIYIANHFGDHAIYPDCRRSFVEPMREAIAAGTNRGLRLIAPYTDLSKTDIALRGKALGLDYSRTWSCYQGGDTQCGLCATCRERRQAMQAAGIVDPTEYRD